MRSGRTRRTPNQALRLLLAEAGWSGAQLAREVNALGAVQGTALHYDRTAVAHWLAGSRPRRPVPALVAEALSRRLGRPVREQDTGLGPAVGAAHGPGAPAGEPSAVERLDEVLRTTGRRRVALAGAYSLAALAIPYGPSAIPHGALTVPHGPAAIHRGPPEPGRRSPLPPGRVGMAHVAAAHELLALFSRGDAVLGAGPVYEPLRQYLSASVLPWLQRDMKPAVRRELLTVASRLTYLCAFTHFDMNRHAAAQRLYLTSVELAREAGDRVGCGLALRGLSVQAHALGHFAEAHHLAERAAETALHQVPPHQQAFFHGQLAVALAGRGDPRHARHLAAAERCLERSQNGDTPVGAFHPGSLALQPPPSRRAGATGTPPPGRSISPCGTAHRPTSAAPRAPRGAGLAVRPPTGHRPSPVRSRGAGRAPRGWPRGPRRPAQVCRTSQMRSDPGVADRAHDPGHVGARAVRVMASPAAMETPMSAAAGAAAPSRRAAVASASAGSWSPPPGKTRTYRAPRSRASLTSPASSAETASSSPSAATCAYPATVRISTPAALNASTTSARSSDESPGCTGSSGWARSSTPR
ncbi:hypothetical protein SMICM304S_06657 [Streptomyces microflavus]